MIKEKVTKDLFFSANLGTEKDMFQMTEAEALTQLDKVLKRVNNEDSELSLWNDTGSLTIHINAKNRKKYRELFEYIIFTDIYGESAGAKRFIEYKERQEQERKAPKTEKAEKHKEAVEVTA